MNQTNIINQPNCYD